MEMLHGVIMGNHAGHTNLLKSCCLLLARVERRVVYKGSHKTLMVHSAAQRKGKVLYAETLEARDKDNGPSHSL